MDKTLMSAFIKFPKEGAIIGRLLAGYGELELMLCMCAATARDDFNMVFKAMFRPRGESQRINIGDAIGREAFRAHRLATHFSEAISDMRHCLKIRNQYAHCYWSDDHGRCLRLVLLEDVAKKKDALANNLWEIPATDIHLGLLKEQEVFFFHTGERFTYLQREIEIRARGSTKNSLPVPKKATRPPLRQP